MQILVSGPSQLIKKWNIRFTSRNTEQQQSNTCLTCWCHESVPNWIPAWLAEVTSQCPIPAWLADATSQRPASRKILYTIEIQLTNDAYWSVNSWKSQLSPSQNYFLLKTCIPSTIKLGIELPLDIRSLFLIFGIAEKILYVFN